MRPARLHVARTSSLGAGATTHPKPKRTQLHMSELRARAQPSPSSQPLFPPTLLGESAEQMRLNQAPERALSWLEVPPRERGGQITGSVCDAGATRGFLENELGV